ncbi:MAG: hypothetical protein ACP5IB_10390, partial [Thermoplasmata archaeon]
FIYNSIITNFAYDSNMLVDVYYGKLKIGYFNVIFNHDEGSIFVKKILKNISSMFFSLIKIRIYYSPFRFMLPKLKPIEKEIYKKVK